nr:hypothetical protein [uncultured Sphaerochaeta sp.]
MIHVCFLKEKIIQGWYWMHCKKWSLFVLLCALCFLFVGCEDANIFPQNRELVIINGTTDMQIFEISIEAFPFGQRATTSYSTFRFEDLDTMDPNEQFAITLSPYVYRIVANIRYSSDEPDSIVGSSRVTIDLPAKASQPTYITLINEVDATFPAYTVEVTGEYVAYQIPILA